METRFIDKVGVELEGGWNRDFLPNEPIIFDQSVGKAPYGPPAVLSGRPCGCGDGCKPVSCCHWGEIASPPLQFVEALKWTRDHFPDGVNLSCGFHVHISLKTDLLYAMLMSKRYFDHFLVEVKEWAKKEKLPKGHPFWERYNNKYNPKAPDVLSTIARFCNRPYAAPRQIHMTHKADERRTPLNYCHALHGTIECRLFPAFEEVERCLSAIDFFVRTTEEWLAENIRNEKKRTITIRL